MGELPAEPRALRRIRSNALRLTILDGSILIAGGMLVFLTLLVAQNAAVVSLTRSTAADLIAFSALTVSALSISILAWIRSRDGRVVAALHESSAFLLAGTLNAALLLPMLQSQRSGVGRPALAALLDTTLVSAAVGAVLLFGVSRALKRRRISGSSVRRIMAGPVVVSLLTLVLVYVVASYLAVNTRTERIELALDPYEPAEVVMHLGIAVAFLVGAVLYRRLFISEGRIVSAFMCIGLVVVAGSQVQIAIAPQVARWQLAGDLAMRVAFYAIVLSGYGLQLRSDVRAMRRTSRAIGKSRRHDLLHAVRAERFRAGREIHDGIAQDLAAARLPIKALRRAVSGNAGLEAIVASTEDAISQALDDTRQAIETLRRATTDSVPVLPDLRKNLNTDDNASSSQSAVHHLANSPHSPLLP